jgi:hypothetical protein
MFLMNNVLFPGFVRVRQEWRRAAAGVVRAAAAKDARTRERRLVRGDQGPHGEDCRGGAKQMVSQTFIYLHMPYTFKFTLV